VAAMGALKLIDRHLDSLAVLNAFQGKTEEWNVVRFVQDWNPTQEEHGRTLHIQYKTEDFLMQGEKGLAMKGKAQGLKICFPHSSVSLMPF